MIRNVIFTPLFFFNFYVSFVIYLYAFGPVDFIKVNVVETVLLLLLYVCAFNIGFLLNSIFFKKEFNNSGNRKVKLSVTNIHNFKTKSVCLVIVALAISIININVYVPGVLSDPLSIPIKLVSALIDPLDAYQDSFSNTPVGILGLVSVLLSPIYYLAMILFMFEFKKLSYPVKFTFIFVLIFECLRWVLLGRNKGVFDVFFIIVCVVFIKFSIVRFDAYVANGNFYSIKLPLFKKIFMLFIPVIPLWYFSNAIESRKAFFADYSRHDDLFIMSITPEFLKPLLINLTDYLAQGLHSFSHVFEVNWSPTFGIGFSRVLIDNFSSALSYDFFNDTYQNKLDIFGIDPFVNWHSSFMWLANDLHWLGVVFFMFAFGWYYSFIYCKSILTKKIHFIVMFYFLTLSIFYIPANTQVFMQTGSFFSFVIFFIIIAFNSVRFLRISRKVF